MIQVIFPAQYQERCDVADSYIQYCHCCDKDDRNLLNLHSLLMTCKYNWFEFLEQYQSNSLSDTATASDVKALLNDQSLRLTLQHFNFLTSQIRNFLQWRQTCMNKIVLQDL